MASRIKEEEEAGIRCRGKEEKEEAGIQYRGKEEKHQEETTYKTMRIMKNMRNMRSLRNIMVCLSAMLMLGAGEAWGGTSTTNINQKNNDIMFVAAFPASGDTYNGSKYLRAWMWNSTTNNDQVISSPEYIAMTGANYDGVAYCKLESSWILNSSYAIKHALCTAGSWTNAWEFGDKNGWTQSGNYQRVLWRTDKSGSGTAEAFTPLQLTKITYPDAITATDEISITIYGTGGFPWFYKAKLGNSSESKKYNLVVTNKAGTQIANTTFTYSSGSVAINWTPGSTTDNELTFTLSDNDNINTVAYTHTFTVNNPVAPTISTSSVSTTNLTSATLGGNISNDGGGAITSYGYYYSTSSFTSGSLGGATRVEVGTNNQSGAFSQSQTGLNVGTAYHVMAYATNKYGLTGYGSLITFNTSAATLSLESTVDYDNQTMTITPTSNLTGSGVTFYVCADCTAKPDGAGNPSISWNSTTKKLDISGTTVAGNYAFRVKLKPNDNCLGDAYYNADKSVTITMKTLPDYSSKTITHTINSAAGDGYIVGAGTSESHYKLYRTQAAAHGRIDLRMDYSGVDDAKDAIYYSVGGSETGVMTDAASVASATMSLNTVAGNYSPAIKVYAKVDGQKKDAFAASTTLYYDIVNTPALGLALNTTADAAIGANAGLEVGTSFKLVPTLTGAIRNGAYVTYSYSVKDANSWTEIATGRATNTAYTWSENLPTEPNIYTIKATYTDLGVTVEATQDIVYWKDYTIYVWETGQNLNTADQNITRVHEYYKANSNNDGEPDRSEHSWTIEGADPLKTTTDLSATWGGGWHSFDLKWPLYNYFIVGYNAYNADKYQSNYYYLATKPEDLYLQCNYNGSGKWTWGVSAITAPQQPEITITAVNVYATKIVVDVAIDNHYSLLTAHNITINGATQDGSRDGTVTEVGGGTYRYTLTGLTENTEYTFRATATNALGTSTKAETVTTNAKMPITFTIKVSAGLMANAYWGANGTTKIGVKYYNDAAGLNIVDKIERKAVDGDWWWYEYTFEDSPCNFYVFNGNGNDGSGANRSAEFINATANSCTEVINETDNNSNHKLRDPENGLCGTHFKLEYFNGKTTTVSNVIGDASEKMSLFIGAYNGGLPAGRSLKLFKFTTGWDGGTAITLSDALIPDSAVYVVSLKKNVAFDDATSTSWDFEKYTGNYYIRTEKADGGWNNYKGSSNQMTYSAYSISTDNSGEKYSHYWMKWVAGSNDAGRKVKFDVANEYNNSLSNGNAGFVNDDYTNNDGAELKQNANVRFMYNSQTNKLSRAYLSGSSNERDLFLVLRGNASNKLYQVNTDGSKGSEHTTNGTSNWAFFKDNNNWIYQADVYALPNTRIKLTAQMTNKSGTAENQYFKGEKESPDNTFASAKTDLLIGGDRPGSPTDADYYKMRVIYDFKTNRLMTAWLPSDLNSDLAINADVMLVREGQGGADQITLNNHTLSEVKTIYSVMQFNRWKLNNRANPTELAVEKCTRDAGSGNRVYDETITNTYHPALASNDANYLSESARNIYWISFPFDVNLNEVFGSLGTYGVQWGIEYYDGKARAQQGYWADSPGFWKLYPNTNRTLKAYEGYLLVLDLDYFAYNNTETWANNVQQLELYFPYSSTSALNIATATETVNFDQTGYQCTIDRRTNKTTPDINEDRRIADSYWHCMGVPSFHNVTKDVTEENPESVTPPEAGTYWTPTGNLYLYEWNPGDNSYTVKTNGGSSYPFKSLWAYMVQYSGTTLTWSEVSKVNKIVARRAIERADYSLQLDLMRGDKEEDHTLMRMTEDEGVTSAFEFNHDLFKEMNGGKGNIWTITSDAVPVAGSSMPFSEQKTVVPVGVKIATEGEYTFAIPEGTEGVGVVMVDKVTGTRTNLGLTDYTVWLEAGTCDARFEIEISPVEQVPTGIDNSQGTIDNSQCGVRKVLIDGVLYIIRDGKVYDATGKMKSEK